MTALALRGFHEHLNASFTEVNGMEVVDHYGDPVAEHAALQGAAGILDLSCRSRLCLLGADRQKFLNGQVTNTVKDLKVREGCYAALVNAKGKMQSDLNIYILADEILLDFEPGYGATVAQRLEKYIISDDVQVTDVSPHYGLLSVQGPLAAEVIGQLDPDLATASRPMSFTSRKDAVSGEIYSMNLARVGSAGFDLFIPAAAMAAAADKLVAAAKSVGGRPCGWQALEAARIEAGIPRFGVDMDESHLAPEAGIEARAISYSKGCYIGQEVIARIRTYGQVAKSLRGLQLSDSAQVPPRRGDKLYREGKEVGYVTSTLLSPAFKTRIALGYVRREHNQIGTELVLRTAGEEIPARIIDLPALR